MDVLEACRSRRTIHQYEPTALDEGVMREALQAALYAPNHKFTFPWKFLWVGPETRRMLMALSKEIKGRKREAPWTPQQEAALDAKLHKKIANPELVVFCVARCDDDFRQREDYATVCCSIQNFCLVMTAHGYGTKWSSGAVTYDPETYEILSLDPDAFEIVGFLWAGVSAETPSAQKRPALEQVLEMRP